MWKIREDGFFAENKRELNCLEVKFTLYSHRQNTQPALIASFDTAEEVKQKIAEIVHRENAKKLWQIDADGNAFCPNGDRIFRVPLAGEMAGDYIIVKKPKDKVAGEEGFLCFAYDEDEALIIIKNRVDQLNAEEER